MTLFSKQRVAADFDRAARRYDAHAALQRQVAAVLLEKVSPMLNAGQQVLDVGCGTGALAELTQNEPFSALDWLQLDIAPAMCQAARAKCPRGHYIVADAEYLPLQGACVDVVLSSMTLQWLDRRKALVEIQRVLRPAGHYALAIPVEGSLGVLHQALEVCGRGESVVPFPSVEGLRFMGDVSVQVFRSSYSNMSQLLQDIRGVGGQGKRRSGYAGREFVAELERSYRALSGLSEAGELPVEWHIAFIMGAQL